MDRWVGKVAVVTGASAGIGAAIVQELAAKDIIVVALARRENQLKDVAAKSKGKVYTKKCDVSKDKDVVSTFNWIEKTLGGVDILINNAAVALPVFINNGKTEDFASILNLNVLGLSVCTREALKTMRTRGDNGQIIHINSILGHKVDQAAAQVPISMYSASKHAVTALAEALRIELGGLKSKIRVTSLSPGLVYTDMPRILLAAASGTAPEPLGEVPDGHLSPEDISAAVVFCLSTRPVAQIEELTITPIK